MRHYWGLSPALLVAGRVVVALPLDEFLVHTRAIAMPPLPLQQANVLAPRYLLAASVPRAGRFRLPLSIVPISEYRTKS